MTDISVPSRFQSSGHSQNIHAGSGTCLQVG